MKKNCKRLINKKIRIEKVIFKKSDKLYLRWRGHNSSFNSWIDKKDLVLFHKLHFHCIKISQYFSKLVEPFGGAVNVKVELSNYAVKTDIKNISRVDTSSFALKSTLVSLKTEVDKLNTGKLVPVPVDLGRLSEFNFRVSHFSC